MKLLNITTILFLLSLNNFSHAKTLTCKGFMNEGQTTIEVEVKMGKTAKVSLLNNYYNQELTLKYSTKENIFRLFEGQCTDQYDGGHEYNLHIGSDKALFSHYWCDDDGGNGLKTADLICK